MTYTNTNCATYLNVFGLFEGNPTEQTISHEGNLGVVDWCLLFIFTDDKFAQLIIYISIVVPCGYVMCIL